jgi:3-oxoacyl-(acyl-carrier-protein) synthase
MRGATLFMKSPVFINNFGVLTPSVRDINSLAHYCRISNPDFPCRIADIPLPVDMPARDVRRMAPLTRSALYSADSACRSAGVTGHPECGLMLGLTHGATSLLKEFHQYWFQYGPQMASPTAFSNGVTNAPLGAISKHCNLTAGGVTLLGEEECGMTALHFASTALIGNDYRFCCAGGAEEYSELVADVYQRLGWYSLAESEDRTIPRSKNKIPLSEGSCFCVMSRQADAMSKSCGFTPLFGIEDLNLDVDIVVSGACNGPQDRFERDAMEQIFTSCRRKPDVVFPKKFLGETFSAGAILSTAIAWDIIVNQASYPSCPAGSGPDSAMHVKSVSDRRLPQSVIVIAASRSGTILAGLISVD